MFRSKEESTFQVSMEYPNYLIFKITLAGGADVILKVAPSVKNIYCVEVMNKACSDEKKFA